VPSEQDIVKEFEAARQRYYDLVARVAALKIPGLLDEVAAKCSVGEVCHGGEFRGPDIRILPPEGGRG
jgi:hypothetical protein